MVERDIILEKVSNIQRCLKRIRGKTGLNPDSLDDIDTQDIFILNLLRAIESSIDIAAHIVATENLGLPKTIRENFTLLQNAGIIDAPLQNKMENMVGFRNIAVHDYHALNMAVLKAILTTNLKDFEDFYTAVINYFKLT
jgi:uncharacterized protein YutE (UPF0331/DUF86 family)